MTTTLKSKKTTTIVNRPVEEFFGRLVSFNNSLKLYHWHVTGVGSYAQHIALDEAVASLSDTTDRIVETTYAQLGDLNITVPETPNPSNIIKHASDFFAYVGSQRDLFPEAYTQAILDDYQEAIQQLLYKLQRLQ